MNTKERLIYVPLGGAGEIGMNMYLYGYGEKGKERYILIDVGVTFPNMESTPGVDLIMPDPSYIVKRSDRLEAIFITHAHEDHVGAIGHLFNHFNCPIYCRQFTAAISRKKMEQAGEDVECVTVIDKFPEVVQAGVFKVSFLSLPHSVPEASGLIIDTPSGRILHTGDFKLDKTPIIGDAFDPKVIESLFKNKILALVCDSTNIFSIHSGRSESTLRSPLVDLFSKERGMIIATTFASNIARLLTIAIAARETGRSVLVLGRAMKSMLKSAISSGLLSDLPGLVSTEEALEIPRQNLLVLATGSQGEFRAASAQLARDKYMGIELQKEDLFLFSSKTIPGNELAVTKVINGLMELGVKVIDDSENIYHVSGHANRPDLETFHKLVKPKIIIPMHGEPRHLIEHAMIAESNGFKSGVVVNGSVCEISSNNNLYFEETVESGRKYLDGNSLVGSKDGIIKKRIQLATRGHVVASIIIENKEMILNSVWVKVEGLTEKCGDGHYLNGIIEEEIEYELQSLSVKELDNDDFLEESCKRAINRICKNQIGKKPVSTCFINRIG